MSSRKGATAIVSAFLVGNKMKMGNDFTDGVILTLHGNTIAKKEKGRLFISTCGWSTPTTFSRLNCIPGVSATTKKGQTYLNGEKWDGSWTAVD